MVVPCKKKMTLTSMQRHLLMKLYKNILRTVNYRVWHLDFIFRSTKTVIKRATFWRCSTRNFARKLIQMLHWILLLLLFRTIHAQTTAIGLDYICKNDQLRCCHLFKNAHELRLGKWRIGIKLSSVIRNLQAFMIAWSLH